jgi:hypothetical protein
MDEKSRSKQLFPIWGLFTEVTQHGQKKKSPCSWWLCHLVAGSLCCFSLKQQVRQVLNLQHSQTPAYDEMTYEAISKIPLSHPAI